MAMFVIRRCSLVSLLCARGDWSKEIRIWLNSVGVGDL